MDLLINYLPAGQRRYMATASLIVRIMAHAHVSGKRLQQALHAAVFR
ncbi:hypothetical protein HL667_31005 [Bradyrhizobium sp. 83012]|uniref:Transposase n=1 Tax=Bradyrhizobium aeschynomenes TaxID=2734909 RepID=A0ABX2CMP0_9BRAD|nr:hypothetical protein [Bradyrhizobium aeschynomenes]NPU14387.1 hypothetical protein [Bradyrhizobium aeschynomenes]NPU69469.1 hypothetical protein [Bradyrhizobium aeschynomenes]NPV20440.1 hypothetical protein [Bradyrhizobium aeschynomenes]